MLSPKLNNLLDKKSFIKELSNFVLNIFINSKKKLRTLNPTEIIVDKIGSDLRLKLIP